MVKKAIIGIVIAIVVIGLGALGFGYYNAKIDKAYANNAKTLVSDFENKYSDDYLEKQLKIDSSGDTKDDLDKAKSAIEQVKKDAESSLSSLNSKKSSKRTATIKQDTEDYFNLTIKACDNSVVYLDYSIAIVDVSESLETTGGSVNSLADAIAAFDSAKNSIDDAIKDLESTTPPAGMEDFHKDMIAALEDLSEVMGKMNAALVSGDLTALETYANELMTSATKFAALDSPSTGEITNNILSSDETQKIDQLPDKISSEADQIAKKTLAF